jgi:hypothetical protein
MDRRGQPASDSSGTERLRGGAKNGVAGDALALATGHGF